MSEVELILTKLKIVSEEQEKGMYLCDKEHSKMLLDYITNLQQEVNQYENPDDMTLFYMWLDEKTKDKMKSLQQENERLNKGLEYAKRVEKDYKEKFDKTIEYLGIDEDILKTCEMYDVNGIEVYKILQGVSNENSNE